METIDRVLQTRQPAAETDRGRGTGVLRNEAKRNFGCVHEIVTHRDRGREGGDECGSVDAFAPVRQ